MNPLAQWFTWEGAPCQVGTRSVKLAGLSSKSTCNSLLHLEFRVHFWLVYSCVQFAVPADWEAPGARFIHTVCMHRIWWSCEGLTSVHNKYTDVLLKHLLLRHMYNLPLPILMCYAQALRSETSYCYCDRVTLSACVRVCPRTVLCSALYTACVDASRTVFWDRSVLR